MKRCSASLVNRKIHINTTPITGTNPKSENAMCWKDVIKQRYACSESVNVKGFTSMESNVVLSA